MNRPFRSLMGLVGATLLLVTAASPGFAQSLLASGGLGLPSAPLDARAQALGGVGLGLPGVNLSLVNPASVAGLPAPALSVVFQPTWTHADFAGGEVDFSTSRFPLIHAAAPLGTRWVVSAGYGAVLDQNFALGGRDTLNLTGTPFDVRDSVVVAGGVARLRVGSAYMLTERLAVGAAIDVYTGSRSETYTRQFSPVDTAQFVSTPDPAREFSEAQYSGTGFAIGARWSPSAALTVSASVADGGLLEITPADTVASAPGPRSYSLPLRVSSGASGRITRAAMAVIGAEWARWSAAEADLAASGGARDAISVGGGIEWDPPSRGDRTFPLRVGARYAQLPFRWSTPSGDLDFPDEQAVTAGIGARLAGGAAMVDLTAERGARGGDGAGVDEGFWRASLSLTLLAR